MTTPLRQLAQINRDTEMNQKASAFCNVARWLAVGKNNLGNTLFEAQAARATPQIIEAIKAASQAGTTADAVWGAPLAFQELSDAFLVSLRNYGVFDAALPFAVDVPMNMSVAAVTAGATGATIPEGQVKVISKISLSATALTPKKAVAIIAVTSELLKHGGVRAARLFQQELSRAISAETDRAFLAAISTGVTPTASSGSNAVAIAADMGALLGALSIGVGSKVFIAMEPGAAKHFAIQVSTTGAPAFPGLNINGGDYCGCTVIPTDALSGSVVAFDASQIAMASTGVELDSSDKASVQMDTTPDSPPSASSNMVSLWQLNQSALKATRWFGASVLRTGAVAALSSVSWGSANSPA
jgi:HK97 family phage major capsid protein